MKYQTLMPADAISPGILRTFVWLLKGMEYGQ